MRGEQSPWHLKGAQRGTLWHHCRGYSVAQADKELEDAHDRKRHKAKGIQNAMAKATKDTALALMLKSACHRAQQDEVRKERVYSQLSKISVEKETARIKALEEQHGLRQMGPAHSEPPVPKDQAVAAASKACAKTTPQAGGSDAGQLLPRQWGSQGEANQGS